MVIVMGVCAIIAAIVYLFLYFYEYLGKIDKESKKYKYALLMGGHIPISLAGIILFYKTTDTTIDWLINVTIGVLLVSMSFFNKKILKVLTNKHFLIYYLLYLLEIILIAICYVIIVKHSMYKHHIAIIAGVAGVNSRYFSDITEYKKTVKRVILLVTAFVMMAMITYYNYNGKIETKPIHYVNKFIKENQYNEYAEKHFFIEAHGKENRPINYGSIPLKITRYTKLGKQQFIYYKETVTELKE